MGALAGTEKRGSGLIVPTRCGLLLLSGLLLLLLLPGCRGCRRTTPAKAAEDLEKQRAEQRAKLEKPKPKPDLEIEPLRCYPHEIAVRRDDNLSDRAWCKPGHWTCGSLAAKANNFDLLGDLQTAVTDGPGRTMGLVGMPYCLEGSRSVALAKGQRKVFEPIFFVPASGRPAMVSYEIDIRKGGRGTWGSSRIVAAMPGYQYYFVVLARISDGYSYVRGLDAMQMPTSLGIESEGRDYYRVVMLDGTKQTPLPDHALFWTSIAYVLWDDAEPEALTLDQQLALLDWLHWGGQLILSGPDTLDSLRRSFLAPYLPAISVGKREIAGSDLEPLNDTWALTTAPSAPVRLRPSKPWSGVRLKKHPQATGVEGTGELLVERRVGRGRIVASAFRLTERDLRTWPSFDSFWNGAVLGRAPRKFGIDQGTVSVTWRDLPAMRFDPRLVCNLRYFTRDTGRSPITFQPDEMSALIYGTTSEVPDATHFDVASWTDFNGVANTARETLQSAARIEVPHRSFVLWVVGSYLVVLVPLNWLVFRILGRVEWAWAAAPLIAVACTVAVIWLARLDIGFLRSMTEVAVVELQGDYPRAHVTRYDALYTSLTTHYQFRSKDLGTQVQPFPTVGSPDKFRLLPGQGLTTLKYVYGSEVNLTGYSVQSNSTGLVHAEQMVDLGGPIALVEKDSQEKVVNRTFFTVHDAQVIRKDHQGAVERAWVGTLGPGRSADLRFMVGAEAPLEDAEKKPRESDVRPRRTIELRQLRAQAEDAGQLAPGQARLVGWSDEEIPGLEIVPAAPQARYAVLVVANLRYGPSARCEPDVNSRYELEATAQAFPPEANLPQATKPGLLRSP